MEANAQLISNEEKGQTDEQKTDSSFSITTFVWRFFSVISWLFLVVSSFEAYKDKTVLYQVHKRINGNNGIYIPISIELNLLQTFYLLLLFFGFFNYIYFGIYKKDELILKPMFEKFSRFHFIPLIIVSLINIIMQDSFFVEPKTLPDEEFAGHLIAALVLDIVALVSLLLVYAKTQLKHDWFIVLTIKKGVYSFLIIMLWHNLFYLIIMIRYIKGSFDDLYDFFKGAGISFAIIIGIGSILFSFAFKDIIAAVTNFLIYAGMVNSFFGYKGKNEEQKEVSGGVADGVLEIVMMAINFSFILFLVDRYITQLERNKFSLQLDTYY